MGGSIERQRGKGVGETEMISRTRSSTSGHASGKSLLLHSIITALWYRPEGPPADGGLWPDLHRTFVAQV